MGVEADAALGRAPAEVVLDPVALQHLERAVVAPQRYGDLQAAPGGGEQLVQPLVDPEVADGLLELEHGGLKG